MTYPMIEKLIELGDVLEKQWERDSFPETALKALSQFDISISLKDFENEMSEWMLHQKKLPDQLNLYNTFGEPPVTLFNNGKLAVDIYFWRKNDTLIHSHAFRGAFKVIYGRSLHEEFLVEVTDSVAEDIVCSNLTSSKLKIMKEGDVQIIRPGTELVHRVVHLDNPTVTLCLRTVEDVELRQWHHLSTGLSYQKQNLDEMTIKRILYFQFIYQSDPLKAEIFLHKILDRMEISAQLNLYESIFFNEFGIDYDISCVILDVVRLRFERQKWFELYESHYKKLESNLQEHYASNALLKVLAHGINCNYSVSEIERLLSSTDSEEEEKDIATLCQELLEQDSVFVDDYVEIQREAISRFVSEM